LPPHLAGAFWLVLQSRSYGYAPSSQAKNLAAICVLSFNKYWGTGSKYIARGKLAAGDVVIIVG
ncbi:MAG: hypothetical protein K2L14_01225, partial [Duncaniella sp.]|nr:hypothetical protein [Duncaniella sp.]